MCRPSEEGSLSPQRGTMRGDLLCSAACPSPPHHVCSHHSPMRGVGAILAQSLSQPAPLLMADLGTLL